MTQRRFVAHHDAYIHDLAYDFAGRRLATCSSDQHVKIWDQDSNGKWYQSSDIKQHMGSVLKVDWAHPEFGQLLASCSTDRQVLIYEEQVEAGTDKRTWRVRAKLNDARAGVQDVKFGPHQRGLQLATCSLDGFVRIYAAVDLMNLTSWSLVHEFSVAPKDCYCISWNPSAFDLPTLVVGSATGAQVWELHNESRRWQPVADLGSASAASASAGAARGKDSEAMVCRDVSFAPNFGRSFHMIATACTDGKVRIYKLKQTRETYEVSLVAELMSHGTEVWRVAWNLSGTVLASTGDDGTCRLWKADWEGKFKCSLVVRGSEQGDAPADDASQGDDASASASAAAAAPAGGVGLAFGASRHG